MNRGPIGTLIYLVVLTTLCSLALTLVTELTRETREERARQELRKVLCQAAGVSADEFADFKELVRDDMTLMIRPPEKGGPMMVAIARCPGLWDQITFALALAPGLQPGNGEGFTSPPWQEGRILGLAIVSQKETPGLGGRIQETPFLESFRNIPTEAEIRFMKTGEKPLASGDLDGITGATMTCGFLARGINQVMRKLRGGTASGQTR